MHIQYVHILVRFATLVVLLRCPHELVAARAQVVALLHQAVQRLTPREEVVHRLYHRVLDRVELTLDAQNLVRFLGVLELVEDLLACIEKEEVVY